jgi:hypothetical protein
LLVCLYSFEIEGETRVYGGMLVFPYLGVMAISVKLILILGNVQHQSDTFRKMWLKVIFGMDPYPMVRKYERKLKGCSDFGFMYSWVLLYDLPSNYLNILLCYSNMKLGKNILLATFIHV